jgi:hypothetical protein
MREQASAGEITMWGIRAIRVGVFLSGLLVTIAGSGCCENCQSLWGTKSAPPAAAPQPDGANDANVIRGPVHAGPGWDPNKPDDAKESHLTPERIHGGIY